MDDIRFDGLTATFATDPSRRRLLGAFLGAALAGLREWAEMAAAKKKNNKKKKKCPVGRPRCGNKCCQPEETCRQGSCRHHCQDGLRNRGESDTDCGRVCADELGLATIRCKGGKRCVDGADCRSGLCEEVEPGAGTICIDCRIDSDCPNLTFGERPRCIENFCFECFLNADCPGQFNPPEERFCVSLPVAAGLNELPCPNNLPCVCRECRNNGDCPQERPHCQTGTGTVTDGVCFACLEDTHCPPGQLCDEEGRCESFECQGNGDCASGCCDNGICSNLNDVANCGSCGNSCPGGFPNCVRCCGSICKQFARDPAGECPCP